MLLLSPRSRVVPTLPRILVFALLFLTNSPLLAKDPSQVYIDRLEKLSELQTESFRKKLSQISDELYSDNTEKKFLRGDIAYLERYLWIRRRIGLLAISKSNFRELKTYVLERAPDSPRPENKVLIAEPLNKKRFNAVDRLIAKTLTKFQRLKTSKRFKQDLIVIVNKLSDDPVLENNDKAIRRVTLLFTRTIAVEKFSQLELLIRDELIQLKLDYGDTKRLK